jgi:hypothetical protein
VVGEAISFSNTGGTTVEIPKPIPEINLPINKQGRFPRAARIAPTIKNELLKRRVNLLPFLSDGIEPNIHPIHPPMTSKAVAN